MNQPAILPSKSKGLRRKVFFSLFLLIILTLSQINSGQNTPEITTLETGKKIEREIAGKQKHSYQIILAEGQFASLEVEQRGIDVVVRAFAPDAKIIYEADFDINPNGREKIEMVALQSGVYRIEIEPKYPLLRAGRYEIEVVQVRAALEKDKSLQTASKDYFESVRLSNVGKFDEALPLVENALKIRLAELGEDNSETAIALNQLARIYTIRGNFEKAEQTNQRALSIREKIFGAEHPDVALSLHNLALLYDRKEELGKALLFHQRALKIRENVLGLEHPVVATSFINTATVYDHQGNKPKAVEMLKRALTIQENAVGIESLNGAVIINNLAKSYVDLGEYAKAEPLLKRALVLLEKLFGPDNFRLADPLTNLARFYMYQGDYAAAEPVFQHALKLYEKFQGAEHPATAMAIHNLGSFYFFKGDYGKSEEFSRQSLAMREKIFGPFNPSVARTLNVLSRTLAMKGDISEAVNLQQRANAITEKEISLNFAVGSEKEKLAYLDILPEQTNQTISTNIQNAATNPAAAELAALTLIQRKGRVLDAMSDSISALRQRAKKEDFALLDELNKTTEELAKLVVNGPQKTTLAEHQTQIKKLEEKREKLEVEINRRTAGFYESSAPVSLKSIQAALPAGTALVEFAVYQPFDPKAKRFDKSYGEPHYIAYIIQRQGEIRWKELGEAKAIDDAVKNFRQALSDPNRKDVQTLARILDEKVMQPIRSLIGAHGQLFVSPDGELNLIPFEALVDEQNRYLIENYAFTYLTSGRDLLRLQTSRESKSKLLLIANPAFGEPDTLQMAQLNQNKPNTKQRKSITATRNLTDTYFAALGGTVQEARSIQTIFPEAAFLTGAQATESALKQTSAPKILHIATHGFFLEDEDFSKTEKIDNPLLRSGLALAGANRRSGAKDDGILTALEASGLNLWGTKLVVLSACDTGLGEVRNGEGVYGLRRAFMLAGTESLMMSLWSVSDLVTRELMTNYYKNLKQGKGRGAALRQVQLEMLKKANRQHPFYWASFIQSGEWANLDGQR